MRKMYFSLNALITPHIKELDTQINLVFMRELDYVNPAFNEDLLAVEIDETEIVQYEGAEGYAAISELEREGKKPLGLWSTGEGAWVHYNGPIKFLNDFELVERAQSHDLEKVPHIRVIITADNELRTDPWWWSTDPVKMLVKKYAPDWASIGYAGVKVNDKAFEAFYVPTVVKPKQLSKTVENLVNVATSALENVGDAFHTFDKKKIGFDLFF